MLPTNRPAFDWADVTGAASYQLQVSAAGSFGTLLISATTPASDYQAAKDLSPNRLLDWRVRAVSAAVTGPWSAVGTFTTGNPPSAPKLTSPANNALVANYQSLLDWSNSTVPAGVTFSHYQIQVAADAVFTRPLVDQNLDGIAISHFIPASEWAPNTVYYWRVRAFSTQGHYSAWSAVFAFRTALPPPEPADPAHESLVSATRPVFAWQAVPGAANYTIQVSRYSSFSITLVNASATSPSYTPAVNLPRGAILYWRVRANGANGPSLWSAILTFQIE